MYETITDIKIKNKAEGQYFFSSSTMEFFNSKVHNKVYSGKYFITSERNLPYERLYTIREAREDGSINTVGEFQQYRTLDDAITVVKTLD